jgi:hypothetical protein
VAEGGGQSWATEGEFVGLSRVSFCLVAFILSLDCFLVGGDPGYLGVWLCSGLKNGAR